MKFRVLVQILLCAILFWVIQMTGYGQISSADWRVTQYTIVEGLSQSAVSCILQDSRGFLWIGTQDGLNRFDGYQFTVFRHQPGDTASLSNSYIRAIVEDKTGRLWIGTRDGLNRFDPESGTFSAFFREGRKGLSLSNNEIYNLHLDGDHFLWIKTMSGLDRMNLSNLEIRSFRHHYDSASLVSGTNAYFPVFSDDKSRLWVGAKDGLFLFDKSSESFTHFKHERGNIRSISNDRIKSIFQTSRGELWVGTENGLNKYDEQTGEFTRYLPPAQAGLRVNEINDIWEDQDANLWIATEGGLYYLDLIDYQFKPVFLPIGERSVFHREITAIYQDRSGLIWLGTFSGLLKIDTRLKFRVTRLTDFPGIQNSTADVIASVYMVDDEQLWVGTWGAGLYLLNQGTGSITHFSYRHPNPSRTISNDFVHVIYVDQKGQVIIGTRNGADIYDPETGRFSSFCKGQAWAEACRIFRNNRIYSILQDSRGRYWFATQNGLHQFSEQGVRSFYEIADDEHSLPSSNVRDIIESQDGFLYVGTINGLARLDPVTGVFESYQRKGRAETYTISNNEVTTLYEDRKGNLWVGTISGLNRFYRNPEAFVVFSEKDGMPNNFIYAIEEDRSGNIWVSTNKGMAQLNISSWEVTVYDVMDGLQNYEFNLGASFRSQNGQLFFGGISGLNYFYPEQIEINSLVPQIAITSITRINSEGSFRQRGETIKEVKIQPGDDAFTIEFTALDFTRPDKNQYAYILEGLDNKWVEIGSRPMAAFSRLPPGEYVFRVKGSNNDLVWNEEGASLRIIVIAPFYKTTLAYILYLSSFLMLVTGSFLYITRNLRKTNQILREKEIASREVARQREELILKNRNITDSINYAKRIQVSLLPSERLFTKLFPESFIFYKPKDIVSGDFYWVNERKGKVYFAVVDCTGHGVPGAFMSILGLELLRNIISVRGIDKPSEILERLNKEFYTIFSTGDETDYTVRDGMEIGFCVFNRQNGMLEFSGAFSSLYLVRDNSIREICGDKVSVGLALEEEGEGIFNNQEIQIEKNDILYLFTDGYADQFGGEEGKKYKYRRFRHLLLNLHSLPMKEQKGQISESMVKWMGSHEQVDDMLVIGVKPFT